MATVRSIFEVHAVAPPQQQAFPALFGEQLKARRRALRLRHRHLADTGLSVATLKAAERGQLPLDRPLITRLASRYGVDLVGVMPPRDPLVIGADRLRIGTAEELCQVGRLDSMLRSYLTLVGRVRNMDTDPTSTLRRDDVRHLADHLDVPCTTVLSRIADLIDANGAETRAMIDLYLTGATVVGLHEAARPMPA